MAEEAPPERLDRRVGRTKRLLKRALLELIKERGYDRVTVRDIAERADIGRSTFYSHYSDKAELLFDGFDRWVATLPEIPVEPSRWVDGREGFRFALPFLHHIGSARHVFRPLMTGAAGPRLRRETERLLAEVIRRELARLTGASEDIPPEDPRVAYLTGAFQGITNWWVDQACRTDVEEVDRIFQQLALAGLSGARGASRPAGKPSG